MNKVVIKYKRQIIKDLLTQLTNEHIDLFNRMYGSVETITPDKMSWAIQQCERSVNKLKEKDKKEAY